MKWIASVLLALGLGASGIACAEQETTKTFKTPEGSVTMTSKTVAPVPQTIVSASPEQLAKFSKLAASAMGFANRYLPKIESPSLKDFDEAFVLWKQDGAGTYTDDQVIDLLGAYLGKRMVDDLDMEWVVVTDEAGTDFAVRGKKQEILAFPFASVAKRIDRREHDFMAGVYRAVEATIANGEFKTR